MARATSSSLQASPSSAASASISASVRARAAARSANSFLRSMSAAFIRTKGISLSPVCPAQADDPTHRAAICVDAGQNQTAGHADRPQTRLPVVLPVIDLLGEWAIEQFDGPFTEQVDNRQDYGETRLRAIGVAGGLILACVYTDRGPVRRIISLRRANRRERNAFRANEGG